MTRALSISAGDRFGRLTCLEELPRQNGMRYWRVVCDCGCEFETLQKSFASGGKRTSCGCDKRKTNEHGLSTSPEYVNWKNMITRCENENIPNFKDYGGRGIRVCKRWRVNFENFFKDMGPRPSKKHSLDRINVNGHYEPSNCRWALPKTQMRNMRANHKVVVNGFEMTLAEAVDSAPVPYNTVLYRLKRGWSVEQAINLPQRRGRRPHA